MNKGVAIKYGDVAVGAKENFAPEASESQFGNRYKAELMSYSVDFPNYANPCELYQTALDGTASAFPSMPEDANLGLWSEQLSNDDGTFTEPIVLELESEGLYSSQGLTFTFDTYNNIYPTHINIKWFRYADGTMTELSSQNGVDFYPDNAFYFCHNFVENYNKVVITIDGINMPQNRLKLRVIDYGYGTIFYGDELRNVKLIQELDPISSQIAINTADFTLDSKSNIEYSFQNKQPLSIYFNGQLKATTFVTKSTRQAKRLWSVQSEDYIGLLDSVYYYGGIYNEANAVDILTDIFTVANVPYSVDEVFADATVTGYIPFTTCREALMQVAFAIQAVVDTSNIDYVKVYKLPEEDSKEPIPLSRIMQGQNFGEDDIVTGVEVAVHTYEPKSAEDTANRVVAYNAKEEENIDEVIGKNILVRFEEPLHSLKVNSVMMGEIVFPTTEGENNIVGSNYAIIKVKKRELKVFGYGYEHTTQTKRATREDVGVNVREKVVAIQNATLVSPFNVDNVLEKCYNWLIKTKTTNLRIVEGKQVKYGEAIKWGQKKWGTFKWGETLPNVVTYDEPVNVGENIKAETEYLGVVSGRLIKQSFNLNGNIIIKEAVLK